MSEPEVVSRENPAHPGEIVGTVPVSSPADVDAVVRTADAAWRGWAARPLAERADLVRTAADALDAATVEALATVLARELGKPLPDARGEIGFAAVWLRWCADHADEALAQEEVDDEAGRLLVRRVPFGVVAAVTPWNAPVILSMLKVAPALVAGNAVVVKPSPFAPVAITAVVDALRAALPDPDLVSVVHGGPATGEALVGHRLVRKVAFTGGDVVARAIGAVAAEAITPTVMELGGNDAAVFLDDAPVFAAEDPVVREAAYDRIVTATFATSGQVCMASKRLYVPADRLEEFAAGFRAAADRVVRLGDPLVPGVTVGPVVSRAARDRLEALAAASADLGGEVIEVGTVDPSLDAEGYFVRPRLVVGLADDAPLVCDEQFGPIVPLQGYEDVEDVVARANAGDLGLGASVWSLDEERAFAVARRLEAGFVFVNTHNRTGLTMRAPFGGVKRSGFGREYGVEGLREYAQSVVVHAPATFRPGADPAAQAAASRAYPGQR